MRRLARLSLAVATVALTTLSACGSTGHKVAPQIHAIPSPDLTVDDTIDDLDFIVQGGHTVHLVYLVVRRNTYDIPQRSEIWYQQGDLTNGTWSKPSMIKSGSVEQPRVATYDKELDVLFISDWDLEAVSSTDAGRSWARSSLALPRETATSFSVISDRGNLTLLYMGHIRDGEGFLSGRHKAMAMVIGTERRDSVAIAEDSGPTGTGPWPRLAEHGHVLVGAFCFAPIRNVEQGSSGGDHVFIATSRDGGSFWAAPLEASFSPPVAAVRALDILPTASGRFVLLIDDTRVRILHLDEAGRSYEYPQAMGRKTEHQLSSFVAGASVGQTEYVLWIDSRNAKRDALSLVSDQPYWMNNDLFYAHLSDLTDVNAALHQVQVTGTGGYVRTVKAREGKGGLEIVWTGRKRVGRDEKEYGDKYELYHAEVER